MATVLHYCWLIYLSVGANFIIEMVFALRTYRAAFVLLMTRFSLCILWCLYSKFIFFVLFVNIACISKLIINKLCRLLLLLLQLQLIFG